MNADDCSFWYEPLVDSPPQPGVYETRMILVLICDSAFKNAGDKHSQGAHLIGLLEQNSDGALGGKLHIIEVVSRKSRRVGKSTWAAELVALVTGLEKLEKARDWWAEIVSGLTQTRGLVRLSSPMHRTGRRTA